MVEIIDATLGCVHRRRVRNGNGSSHSVVQDSVQMKKLLLPVRDATFALLGWAIVVFLFGKFLAEVMTSGGLTRQGFGPIQIAAGAWLIFIVRRLWRSE